MVSFSDHALDKTFAALAHPIRRAILTRLAKGAEASVTELAEPFDVSVMAISKHLRVMERAGLILRRKDGRVQRCSYDPEAVGAVTDWLEMHRDYWAGRLDSLTRYLEGSAPGGSPTEEDEGEAR